MANFCTQCGTQLKSDDLFCPECGAPLGGRTDEMAAHEGAHIEAAETPPVPEPVQTEPPPESQWAAPAYVPEPTSDGPKINTNVILGIIALVVIAGAGLATCNAFTGSDRLAGNASGNSTAETGNQIGSEQPEGQRATFYVMTEANVRDRPTAEGSKIISKLSRGEELTGTIVMGVDGTSQWLKLDGSEQYVGLVNLDPAPRVPLASEDGSDRVTAGQCTFLATPTEGGAVKVALPAGQPIKRIGVTQNGFAEYGLPKGGVGYIAGGGASCKTSVSKAAGAVSNTLIQFDPKNCNFGSELKPYYDQAIAKRQANGGMQNENEIISVPVNKVYRGLKVRSAYIGYEWQGVYFDSPPAQVREVFRGQGIKVEDDGDIPDSELATGIYPTEGETKKNGQTYLTCGV